MLSHRNIYSMNSFCHYIISNQMIFHIDVLDSIKILGSWLAWFQNYFLNVKELSSLVFLATLHLFSQSTQFPLVLLWMPHILLLLLNLLKLIVCVTSRRPWGLYLGSNTIPHSFIMGLYNVIYRGVFQYVIKLGVSFSTPWMHMICERFIEWSPA